jgi:hypothetical protein
MQGKDNDFDLVSFWLGMTLMGIISICLFIIYYWGECG